MSLCSCQLMKIIWIKKKTKHIALRSTQQQLYITTSSSADRFCSCLETRLKQQKELTFNFYSQFISWHGQEIRNFLNIYISMTNQSTPRADHDHEIQSKAPEWLLSGPCSEIMHKQMSIVGQSVFNLPRSVEGCDGFQV